MEGTTKYPPEILREELARITVKGAARGIGGTLSLDEAREVVAEMIDSDDAPGWTAIREGRDQFATIVALIRYREKEDR